MSEVEAFDGAKVALFLGQDLVVYLRDNKPSIPWPGYWDFPGGGREDGETPEDTVIRETQEEFGLLLPKLALKYRRRYVQVGQGVVWFFVAHLDASRVHEIVFGDEGQRWALWTAAQYLEDPQAVVPLQERLREYLAMDG